MTVLSSVIDQLKAECPTFSNRVSLARSLNNPEPTELPEAWVYRWASAASTDLPLNIVTQTRTTQIVVQIAVKLEDETEGVDHYAAIQNEVDAALLGFIPTDSVSPMYSVKEEVEEIAEGYSVHRLVYALEYFLRQS